MVVRGIILVGVVHISLNQKHFQTLFDEPHHNIESRRQQKRDVTGCVLQKVLAKRCLRERMPEPRFASTVSIIV